MAAVVNGNVNKNIVDITGNRYGRLVAIKCIGVENRNAIWLFKCDCGNEKIAKARNVKYGTVKSCGCLNDEKRKIPKTKTHGESKTRLYIIWKGMRKRCKKSSNNPYYSCRGITVCNEWENYENFRNWAISHGYNDSLTLDRIDNDKGYSPNNCRWVDYCVQSNNRRNIKKYKYNGEWLGVSEISRIVNIKKATLQKRLDSGWSLEDATTIPVKIGNNQTVRHTKEEQCTAGI